MTGHLTSFSCNLFTFNKKIIHYRESVCCILDAFPCKEKVECRCVPRKYNWFSVLRVNALAFGSCVKYEMNPFRLPQLQRNIVSSVVGFFLKSSLIFIKIIFSQ